MPKNGDQGASSDAADESPLAVPDFMRPMLHCNTFLSGSELYEQFGFKGTPEQSSFSDRFHHYLRRGPLRVLGVFAVVAATVVFCLWLASEGGQKAGHSSQSDLRAMERLTELGKRLEISESEKRMVVSQLSAARQELTRLLGSRADDVDVKRLEALLHMETEKSAKLERALGLLKPAKYEQDQNLFVSYVGPGETNDEAIGTVKVLVRNVQFPCVLRWIVGEKEERIYLPAGNTSLELPAGNPVTAFCEPVHTAGWLQAVFVAVIRNERLAMKPGSALGKISIVLKDNDTVVLHCEQPIPPWNAVCVPVKGEWIMVTLERPRANLDTDKWINKKWEGKERFPNTAIFWAHEGSEALARNLAQFFIAHRTDKGRWGRFREPETKHLGLVVRASQDAVSDSMQMIRQEELEEAIVVAFSLLRRQMSPFGVTIQEELEEAKEILRGQGIPVKD